MTQPAKHTPGPWVVHTFTISGKEKLEVLDATGTNACVQANAHLIAAAPAMYEALREAQELIRSLVAEEMIHSTELQRVGNCQANMWEALAQAEARS